jgi:DNA replicative helicase MCM subunit Mcm2 (Cdc46/Mcm family)
MGVALYVGINFADALVMAVNGIYWFNKLDKMDEADRWAILEVME